MVTYGYFWGNSESCKMKDTENWVQVPVLFGFTTCFSGAHNFDLKEKLITARYSHFIKAANFQGALHAAWTLSRMALVSSLSCSPKGLFHSFSSVLKPSSPLSFRLAHGLASSVTREMKAIRRGLPPVPAITSTHRRESVSDTHSPPVTMHELSMPRLFQQVPTFLQRECFPLS